MRTLIVEDDFISRKILQNLLSKLGESNVAVNGAEALEAFQLAHQEGKPYDLICLDIMMPELDGHEVLKRVRQTEEDKGIGGLSGVKIIVTTALGDKDNVLAMFRGGCEAYLVKPISQQALMKALSDLGLA